MGGQPETEPTSAQILESGSQFGRYRVHRLIGSGGVAEVYEASHVDIKKRVAIKVVRPRFAERPDMKERFVREGEAAARIQHPNAVDITDVGVERNLPYLVMEYLEGESLGDYLHRHERLDIEQITNVMLPVIAAVAAGHDTGVVHRDLKPDNVFLATDGLRRMTSKVLDFGVSLLANDDEVESPSSNAVIVGTPHYMSPEQARGHDTGPASDQYAIGVMLYEMATGRLPRDAESVLELVNAVAREGCAPPREINPDLPVAFEEVILKAMAAEPNGRYQNLRALGLALLPFATRRAQEFWHPEFAGDASAADLRQTSDLPTMTPESLRLRGHSTPPMGSGRASASFVSHPTNEARGPRWRLIGGVAVVAALAVAVLAIAFPRNRAADVGASGAAAAGPIESFEVVVETEPTDAVIELDGIMVGTGRFTKELPKDGTTHTLRVRRTGYIPEVASFRDVAPSSLIRLTAAEEAEGEEHAAVARDRDEADDDSKAGRPRRPVKRRFPTERSGSPPASPPAPSNKEPASASGTSEQASSNQASSASDSVTPTVQPPSESESTAERPAPTQAANRDSERKGGETKGHETERWPRASSTDNRDPWLD